MKSEDQVMDTDPPEKLQFDYEQTLQYFLSLADARFRLLGLVPTITGIAVALLARDPDLSLVLPISLLGFLATVGVLFYDQRNTSLYDAAQIRLKSLEALLRFRALHEIEKDPKDRKKLGGSLLGRPCRGLRLFGFIPMWHDLGLAIIYSAALGAWAFLAASSLSDAPFIIVAVPVAVAVAFFIGLLVLDKPTDERSKLREEVQKLVWPDDE